MAIYQTYLSCPHSISIRRSRLLRGPTNMDRTGPSFSRNARVLLFEPCDWTVNSELKWRISEYSMHVMQSRTRRTHLILVAFSGQGYTRPTGNIKENQKATTYGRYEWTPPLRLLSSRAREGLWPVRKLRFESALGKLRKNEPEIIIVGRGNTTRMSVRPSVRPPLTERIDIDSGKVKTIDTYVRIGISHPIPSHTNRQTDKTPKVSRMCTPRIHTSLHFTSVPFLYIGASSLFLSFLSLLAEIGQAMEGRNLANP